MTTIAANLVEIASDSMVALDGGSYSVNKLRRGPYSVFGAAGDWAECLAVLQAFETSEFDDLDFDCSLLELRPDGLWVYEGSLIPSKIKNEFYAIGTGAAFAIGAMKMGATPTEAVAIACEFDPLTRGPIDTMTLGEPCVIKPMKKLSAR